MNDVILEAFKNLNESKGQDDFIARWTEYPITPKGAKEVEVSLDFIHPSGVFKMVDLSSSKLKFRIRGGTYLGLENVLMRETGSSTLFDGEYLVKTFLGKKAFDNLIATVRMNTENDFVFQELQKKFNEKNFGLSIMSSGNANFFLQIRVKYWSVMFSLWFDYVNGTVSRVRPIYSVGNATEFIAMQSFGSSMQELKDIFEGRISSISQKLTEAKIFLEQLDPTALSNNQTWIRLSEEDI